MATRATASWIEREACTSSRFHRRRTFGEEHAAAPTRSRSGCSSTSLDVPPPPRASPSETWRRSRRGRLFAAGHQPAVGRPIGKMRDECCNGDHRRLGGVEQASTEEVKNHHVHGEPQDPEPDPAPDDARRSTDASAPPKNPP